MSDTSNAAREPFPRRTFLKLGAAGAAAVAAGTAGSIIVPELRRKGLMSANGLFDEASSAWASSIYVEAFPTSPLILSPFNDALTVPKALAPVADADYKSWALPPGPGDGQQNSLGNERHQKWPYQVGYSDPLVYVIKCQVNTHNFTSSQVLPINSLGQPTISFDAGGKSYA
ncbi:MAG TPA: hypothetical protein VGC84_00250, partial [Ilumatobacteraceae bacterium]